MRTEKNSQIKTKQTKPCNETQRVSLLSEGERVLDPLCPFKGEIGSVNEVVSTHWYPAETFSSSTDGRVRRAEERLTSIWALLRSLVPSLCAT